MENTKCEIPVTIVLAEDDDGHARLIAEHFSEAGVTNPLVRLRDGREALDFFFHTGAGPHSGPDICYLLLLDIKMPGADGIEVLKRLKADERLKKLPVIMLTTTDDPRDIEACYAAGCNNYLTKPVAFSRFAEVIKRLGLFISIVKVTKL
ncbi:MAG: response regulator [Elusimicrobia bacterium]|nr:response regulator [Elusimicrobiota bacterium]